MPRILAAAALILAAALCWFFWPRQRALPPAAVPAPAVRSAPAKNSAPPPSASAAALAAIVRSAATAPASATAAGPPLLPENPPVAFVSPIAADLNAPGGAVARDLELLARVFDDWRTNHPREGNPVGENAMITATLTSPDDRGVVHLARDHRAINADGELCDRWGTPFLFHQLSGDKMEIRSAGPDRKFGTADDAVRTPEP